MRSGGFERFPAGQRAAFPRGMPDAGHRAHGHIHPAAGRVPVLGKGKQLDQFRFRRDGFAARVVERPHAVYALMRLEAVEDRVEPQKFRFRALAQGAEGSRIAV